MPAALAFATTIADLLPYRPGPSPAPFIALMVLGFIVGIGGHIVRSKLIVGVGVVMIFLATVLLPLQYASDFQ
jgi:hypothetical protein